MTRADSQWARDLFPHRRHRQLPAGEGADQRRPGQDRRYQRRVDRRAHRHPRAPHRRRRRNHRRSGLPRRRRARWKPPASRRTRLDLIVLGTTTPDLIFPSTACLLQHRLGANGCAAFDVNAACSGFVYALGVADKFIRSGAVEDGAGGRCRNADPHGRLDRSHHLRAVRRRRRRGRAQGRQRDRHPQHPPARRRRQEGTAVEPGRRFGRLQADEPNCRRAHQR